LGQLFVGHDWAEDHHDIEVRDEQGRRLGRARLAEGVEGVARSHALVASYAEEPGDVVIATETDRGLFVGSLVAAGYEVYAVNPMSVARYRERHVTSGAKSDPGDAAALAELARTDRHHHRRTAGDSEVAEALKVLARSHQNLVWARHRQVNQVRSTLREYNPAALELGELSGPRRPRRARGGPHTYPGAGAVAQTYRGGHHPRRAKAAGRGTGGGNPGHFAPGTTRCPQCPERGHGCLRGRNGGRGQRDSIPRWRD
jgi:transposase